ncbi:MAG: isopentenyl-diphosphate delta-isomerase, partial [Bacteroidia bacterium]
MEEVVLVDKFDNPVGTMEKMMAHEKGLLHRAFSVFVFNSNNELLIHQRAKSKYHSGGLWTNTCCSHPRPHETVEQAAHRRLEEEMGFDCDIFKA